MNHTKPNRQQQHQRPPMSPAPPVSPRVHILAGEIALAQYRGMTASEVTDLLNQVGETPNPKPRLNVPRPLTMFDLLALVTPSEALDIYRAGTLKQDIEAALQRRDRSALSPLVAIASVLLSENSRQRVTAALTEVVPDLAWTPTVPTPSRSEQLGLRRVQVSEVIQALSLNEDAK